MPAAAIIEDAEQRMDKAIEVLKKSLGGIRTGRANPGLVDSLRVDVYGSPTPIKQVAQVGAPEPTQIVIRPYDAGIIKEIEKAIVASDLGFNPQNDGRVVRINIPPLFEQGENLSFESSLDHTLTAFLLPPATPSHSPWHHSSYPF